MTSETTLRLFLRLEEEIMAKANRSEAGNKTIGRRLAHLRKERGITQIELAEQLGVSQPLVSAWERGELRLHGELIVQLVSILDSTADEILGLQEIPERPNRTKNRRFLRRLGAIDQLPKRDQEALIRTIDAFLSKAS
jgi:transcriptional regulator with XRE-family HTH domain